MERFFNWYCFICILSFAEWSYTPAVTISLLRTCAHITASNSYTYHCLELMHKSLPKTRAHITIQIQTPVNTYSTLQSATPMEKHTYLVIKWREERNGLNSLPKAHFIGQDSISVVSPGVPEPVETLQLVRVQGTACGFDVLRILWQLLLKLKCRKYFNK